MLHQTETRDIELVPVYISTVANLKTLSSLIVHIGYRYPLEGLTHLKRIRKVPKEDGKQFETEILIGLVSVIDLAPSENLQAMCTEYELTLRQYQVPKHEPLMRSQYEAWSAYWPMVLKVHIPSTPPASEAISHHKLRLFVSSMRKLIPLARKVGNACLILDSSGSEIALACHSNDSPLSHCCISAVTSVANHQLQETQSVQMEHKKRNPSAEPSVPNPIEYLCSSCTAIVVREPCIMCSMALLHSRIACVIYAVPNPTSGGLGSRFSIHCETQLNHHFHVYQGLLADDVLSPDSS